MEKRTSEYWQERFQQLEEAQHDTSVQTMQSIEQEFRRTEQVLDGKINAWYQRFASNNKISMIEARRLLNSDELEEFKWDVQDYIKYGEENGINQQWMKELENASAKVHISRLEALKLQTQQEFEKLYGNYHDSIDEHITNLYTSGYYHTAFEVQRGMGVGWQMQNFNSEKVSDIIHKPWAVDGRNFSDRVWMDKTRLINSMHDSLTRMCITGESPDRAIQEISKNMKVSRSQAARIVQTESAAFSARAQESCFSDLGVEEFQVVETLDSNTCDTCGEMDGKHFQMKDYKIGVTVPPFHPNCRGCTCPYFDDEFDSVGERAARGEDGKTYYVPADTTFEEWKNGFVDGDTEARDRFGFITNNNKNNPEYYDFKGKDLETVEREISQNDYETAVIFEDGKAISCQLGNEDTIKFTKHQLKLMKGKDVTHNHPLSTPPSPEDLYLLVDHKAKSFRTCGKNGTYVLEYNEQIKNLPEFGVFSKQYNDTMNALLPKCRSKVMDGMDQEEAIIELGNEIWNEMYLKFGVKPIFERR
mgnify:CR=1 FL=1